MNARGVAKLLHYGIHPEVVASHIARTTNDATGQRITPSRRYRRWKVITARAALAAVALFAYYYGAIQ